MADYEYKSPDQVPISWGESLNMVTKSPAVAKRIFLSKDDAQEYIDDAGSNATPGIRLTVLTDYIILRIQPQHIQQDTSLLLKTHGFPPKVFQLEIRTSQGTKARVVVYIG